MNARLIFQRALHKLDRGAQDEGIRDLETALAAARNESDELTLARALCCLGEAYLLAGDRVRARDALAELLASEFSSEVMAYELQRARQLFDELG